MSIMHCQYVRPSKIRDWYP